MENPVECELKYIIEEEANSEVELLNKILGDFISNGFTLIPRKEENSKKKQVDEYYDTFDFELYNNKKSLRIRNTIDDKKAFYKEPTKVNENYEERIEIEESLINSSIEKFVNNLKFKGINIDFYRLLNFPILIVTNNRTDFYLEKEGKIVCLSFDVCEYKNNLLRTSFAFDKMIEIELVGDNNDKKILNEINNFINKNKVLKINKQSKYIRGIDKTLEEFNKDDNRLNKIK